MLAPVGRCPDRVVLESCQVVLLYPIAHYKLRVALFNQRKDDYIRQHEDFTVGDGKGSKSSVWIDGKPAGSEEVIGRHANLLSTDKIRTHRRVADTSFNEHSTFSPAQYI